MVRTIAHRLSRAALCALLCGLLPASSKAGWSSAVAVSGTPNDVYAMDAGHVTVGTDQGGFEIVGGVQGRQLIGTNAATAFIAGADCFGILDTTGFLYGATSACFNGFSGIDTNVGSPAKRLRFAPGGYSYTCAPQTVGSNISTSAQPPGLTSWTSQSNSITCAAPMAVLRVGGSSYGLLTGTGTAQVILFRDTIAEDSDVTSAPGVTPPRSASLVGDGTVPLRAFVVNGTGGLDTWALDGGFGPREQVPLPPGVTAFRGVSVHQSATEQFGMAIAELTGGGVGVYSAVPVPDPSQFGRHWRASTAGPTVSGGTPAQVHCVGAVGCGIVTGSATGNNVVAYANTSPPNAPTVMGSVSVAEGATVAVPASATDPDGDAVWLTYAQAASSLPPLTIETLDGGTGASITAPVIGAGVCDGGVDYTVNVTALDGRAGHLSAPTQVTVNVTRSSPPIQPLVAPASLILAASGASKSVTASPGPQECASWTYAWSPMSASGITVATSDGGSIATFTPPTHVCDPNGLTETFSVVAQNAFGASPPATVSVQVDPWGPPLEPFASAVTKTQLGGTTASYAPAATHVCDAMGAQVPLVTNWIVDGGVPPNTTFVPNAAGGVVSASTLQVVSADRCANGSVQVLAQNEVPDSGTSAWAPLTIEFEPDLDPAAQAQLTLTQNADGLSGNATVDNLNCLDQRSLQARFVLESAGALWGESVHSAPGPWTITPNQSSCEARTFDLYAELLGTDGGVRSNTLTWTREASDPVLGTAVSEPLVASCEAPGQVVATGTLQHQEAQGACAEQEIVWTQVSGPAVASTIGAGSALPLFVAANTWDGLVSQQVVMQYAARAGTKQTAPAEVSAPIVPATRFVHAELEVDSPLSDESGIIGLRVTLTNTTACAVENATWSTELEGLELIAQSVRLAGTNVSIKGEGTRWTVEGVSLQANGSTVLTMNARPRLLGSPSPRGVLLLGIEPISEETGLGERVATSGCGCGAQSGTAPIAWFALVLLALVARARR